MCHSAAFERELNYTRFSGNVLDSHTAKREAFISVCFLFVSSLCNSCTLTVPELCSVFWPLDGSL